MSGQGVLFSGGSVQAAVRDVRSPPTTETVPVAGDRGDRRPGARQWAMRVATALVILGLVTMSWDRLLNVHAASYNIKLPALAFSLAFVVAVFAAERRRQALLGGRLQRIVLGLTAAIVVYESVRGAFSAVPTAAAAQLAALLSGAVLPALAVLLVIRTTSDLRRALRWLLGGACVAAVFGLYQLLAFYLGWPQGIEYTGVGIGGGIGRISAFNYEPAYFAYYVILALGAYVALRRLDGGEVQWRVLIAFAAVLYLANVRAVPLVVAAVAVLLALAPSRNRRLLVRGAVVAAATVVVALAVPLVIAGVATAQQNAAAQQQQLAPDSRPSSSGGSERRTLAPTADDRRGITPAGSSVDVIQSQLQSVDPDEPTSNGPRLGLYRAVLAQVERSPVFGVGPGNLAVALRRDAPGAVADQGAGQVVANNIWLQALADGGIPLLLLELALIVSITVAAIRRRSDAMYPMAAAWLGVLLVGGMLTSYLFDLKMWAVLALVLVGLRLAGPAKAAPGTPEVAA